MNDVPPVKGMIHFNVTGHRRPLSGIGPHDVPLDFRRPNRVAGLGVVEGSLGKKRERKNMCRRCVRQKLNNPK